MKHKTFLEFTNIHSREQKRIASDAKKIRKQIDRDIEKKKREEEKRYEQQKRLNNKLSKTNVDILLKKMKAASKTKESLSSVIDKIDSNSVKPETMKFIKWVIEQADKLKTNKKAGTFLVTRNFNLIPRILNNPIIQNSKDPKIISTISKLVRTSNIELNPKFNSKNIIANYRMVNNVLFNLVRDLVLELIHSDMMELQGIDNGN